jgi:hypothetical protein
MSKERLREEMRTIDRAEQGREKKDEEGLK